MAKSHYKPEDPGKASFDGDKPCNQERCNLFRKHVFLSLHVFGYENMTLEVNFLDSLGRTIQP